MPPTAQITGDTVAESATVETTFGGVDLRDVKGGARVTAGNSSIRLTGIGGEAYAKTTFNGITISDVAGPVTVENQNGSVIVDARRGAKCQPISLHTTFGPIRVTVPAGAGYNVTARTSFGRIHSDAEITVTGDLSPDSLTGKIGGRRLRSPPDGPERQHRHFQEITPIYGQSMSKTGQPSSVVCAPPHCFAVT